MTNGLNTNDIEPITLHCWKFVSILNSSESEHFSTSKKSLSSNLTLCVPTLEEKGLQLISSKLNFSYLICLESLLHRDCEHSLWQWSSQWSSGRSWKYWKTSPTQRRISNCLCLRWFNAPKHFEDHGPCFKFPGRRYVQCILKKHEKTLHYCLRSVANWTTERVRTDVHYRFHELTQTYNHMRMWLANQTDSTSLIGSCSLYGITVWSKSKPLMIREIYYHNCGRYGCSELVVQIDIMKPNPLRCLRVAAILVILTEQDNLVYFVLLNKFSLMQSILVFKCRTFCTWCRLMITSYCGAWVCRSTRM
jgi:hypothetical protein